jgi:hypothetical protein
MLSDEEKKKRRQKYNQTYYDKNRLRLLKEWRDNFVSKKPGAVK